MKATVAPLLAWFERHARALPWRKEPRNPYHVLVSELMLQQTQVDRVVPRFEAFIRRFPDLEALARAEEDEVVGAWAGLGYYRRARSLHKLAIAVVTSGGRLPSTAARLSDLPGVGPYTAAAVASMAHGEAVPVLDGNVIRVASRVLAFDGDPRTADGRKVLMRWLEPIVTVGPPGDVNEALMELGATVCRPSAPDCGGCPLLGECRAAAEGTAAAYPTPRRRRRQTRVRWVAACCVDLGGRWLVRRVADGPILRGLWLPPIAEIADGEDPTEAAQAMFITTPSGSPDVLPTVRHSITHRRIRVTPVLWRVPEGWTVADGDRWVRPGTDAVPTSTLLEKLFRINRLSEGETS